MSRIDIIDIGDKRRILALDRNFSKIITLCGSTRFKEEFLFHQKRLELEGNIVISVGFFGQTDGHIDINGDPLPEKESNNMGFLDQLHFRKIDLADEIFVINRDGYTGESCRGEIRYAEDHGVLVKYMIEKGKETWKR